MYYTILSFLLFSINLSHITSNYVVQHTIHFSEYRERRLLPLEKKVNIGEWRTDESCPAVETQYDAHRAGPL
jgi:hypothetical protein